MKRVLYISFVALVCSCSLLNNDELDAAIEKQKEQAIKEINTVAERAVSDAKAKIDENITKAIGEADDKLESAIEAAESTIKENVNAEIKKQTEEIKNAVNKDVNKAKKAGLLGILFGLFGLVCALFAVFKKKTSNTEHIPTELFLEELQSQHVRDALDKVISNSTLATNVKSNYATRREVNEIRSKIDTKSERYDATYRQPESLSRPIKADDSEIDRLGKQNVVPTTHIEPSIYKLYANETRSMVISDVDEKYQPGYSIYRLILQHPDSTTAEIELCTNYDDAKRRIIKYDNSLLSPICEIKRMSDSPKDVVILEKGAVERVSQSEWKVIKKITVELR